MEEIKTMTDYAQGYSHDSVVQLWDKIEKVVISDEDTSVKSVAVSALDALKTSFDEVVITDGAGDATTNPAIYFKEALDKDAVTFGDALVQFMASCKIEIFNASAAFTAEDTNMATWIEENTPGENGGGQ